MNCPLYQGKFQPQISRIYNFLRNHADTKKKQLIAIKYYRFFYFRFMPITMLAIHKHTV